jgi:hypothetical protein
MITMTLLLHPGAGVAPDDNFRGGVLRDALKPFTVFLRRM